ncbi:MAG: zf-HC2 domain-containing protein [Mycobacteriales bacterium]
MSAHLGPAVTAFVDGELDDARREEVLGHLAHCAPCRGEVDALRRFKAALRGTDGPAVPIDLSERLLAVTRPCAPPARSRRVHLPLLPAGRLRRTAMGGALVVLGLGGALSVAGPAPRGPVAPVDPTSSRFVLDHATTSGEVPFTAELDVVSVSSR